MDFVVTRAPFRVSFAGGGSDLPSFYEREYGKVVSTTIDKYVYVMINQTRPILGHGVDDTGRYRIRLSYATTENVQTVDQLRHPIVREALRLLDLNVPMDIATMADVPAGNGLGSSGTFSVALLQALHLVKGEEVSCHQLAAEAAHIEIEILGRPVGKQDHYAAAFGGLNSIHFEGNGDVTVRPLGSPEMLNCQLFPCLMLLYTGVSRDAGEVLAEQRDNVEDLSGDLASMREHAHQLERFLEGEFSLKPIAEILHGTWMRKRTLAANITNGKIDEWYDRALAAGAMGGKICGAGGGGFLLLVLEPNRRAAVREALSELPELSIGYEPLGSQVLLPSHHWAMPDNPGES